MSYCKSQLTVHLPGGSSERGRACRRRRDGSVRHAAGRRYEDLARDAIRSAPADAGLALDDVGPAFASYVYGDSACGQAALYGVGMTGVPVVNVNNNCDSGSSALRPARQAVAGGETDVALAFGFEQMRRGAPRRALTRPARPRLPLPGPPRRAVRHRGGRAPGRPALRRGGPGALGLPLVAGASVLVRNREARVREPQLASSS
ncbi:thiolase family protein [Thermocatellispora tengchongensis]|uniref:thiolase family protein n=1 Tax=Thermocatellispora tengchongensis TaxID=1073253 RepID=UPI0035E4640D